MIDELAKALCEDAGWRWGRNPVLDERYRRRVRTVLRRLRDPTPEMVHAGLEQFLTTNVKDISVNGHCGRIFRAMIDAAIRGD